MAQEYPEYVLICLDAALLHEVYVVSKRILSELEMIQSSRLSWALLGS